MNCSAFEQDAPDWVTGRLSSEKARRMQTHCAQCLSCRQKTERERRLQRQWQSLPMPPAVLEIEIGPRLASRVADAARRRRSAGFRAQAVGGIAVAASLCFVLVRANFPEAPAVPAVVSQNPAVSESVSEPGIAAKISIAQRVEKMRVAPAVETDAFLIETQQRHQEQRFALLGKDAP